MNVSFGYNYVNSYSNTLTIGSSALSTVSAKFVPPVQKAQSISLKIEDTPSGNGGAYELVSLASEIAQKTGLNKKLSSSQKAG